ncbi:MAG: hypothetical protein IJM71_01355 [Clostridia bacterium]|nr:hypothetical protein [Clostridia bacterium]
MNGRRKLANIALYAMFGATMFVSKLAMEGLPNVHPVTMLIMVLTFAYGWRAVFPLTVYIFLVGIYAGFSLWWIPYLYIWAIFWAISMLIPYDGIPVKVKVFVLPLICGFFGLIYGTLYAPAQALMFGMNFGTTLKWIAAGLPWDGIHAVGNFSIGFLIVPLTDVLKKLRAKTSY